MDDRTFILAVVVLGGTLVLAVLGSFVAVPAGAFTTLAAIAAFLGARGVMIGRKNDE